MAHDFFQETVPFDPAEDAAPSDNFAPAAARTMSAKGAAAAQRIRSNELPEVARRRRDSRANALQERSTIWAGGRRADAERAPQHERDNAVAAGLPGVRNIGHYELIRELGRGGMGAVYLARDLKLARRVAIKFIHAQCAELTERFVAEARTTARCHHENIVVIHEISEHAGNPYMVLEYLRGQSLRQLSAHGPMSPECVLELIIPVARALESAHARGIVHRDLKPENIMVTETGTVKVLDFGIAKVFADSQGITEADPAALTSVAPLLGHAQTRTGAMVGTLPYMSPEQLCNSADVDQCTDIWAVGMIVFEFLLGRHPLAPLDNLKLQSVAEIDDPMPSVVELVPHAGKLGEVIERCLVKRRQDRLATASELVAELGALTAPGVGTKRLPADESPFAGLAAFQQTDADRFYGRAREIASVVAKVQHQPLVTLVGPSGAGKSSLVRAGVIPALERTGGRWNALLMRPGRDPLAALGNLVSELHAPTDADPTSAPTNPAGVHTAGMATALATRLDTEPGLLGRELRAWARRERCRVLLFIDQFEELYTLVRTSSTRTAFLRCLEGAADDASSPLRVVLSIRSDFLDRVVEDNEFMNEVTRGLVLVPPMDREGLCEALTKPVEAAGYGFESAELVTEMLDALEGTAGALPLLQFTASALWENRDRDRRLLTRARYQSFGGIGGALVQHGDSVLAGMSAPKLHIAHSIFERLVTPERTRAVATLGELRELPADPGTIEEVIEYLATARLVAIESNTESKIAHASAAHDALRAVAEHQGEDGMSAPGSCLGADNSTIELIHESLIESWPTLRRWLDDRHEDAAFLARLREAAKQWHTGARNSGMLWTGDAARDAERWHQRFRGELNAREQAYLDAVFANLGRATRIRRYAIAGSMGFLILLLVAATIALWLIQDAKSEATANLERSQKAESEAQTSLDREIAMRQQAQKAQQEAEQARQEAEDARADAEREAQKTRAALDEAQTAREQTKKALNQAQISEHAAREAARTAKTAQATADEARDKAEQEKNKATKEAEHNKRLIRRAVGSVKDKLR